MSEPPVTEPPNPNNVTITSAPGIGEMTEASEIVAPPGYELLAEIGRGGMGIVFRARDLELGREVAVKILQPQCDPNTTSGRRFVEEARITGRLQHPGIPAIYRVGTVADGRPFLAMKLIGGRTLDNLLKERAGPVEDGNPAPAGLEKLAHRGFDRLDALLQRGRFLSIFENVAQAVGYAHKEGLIHRDLKPSNIMVGEFGEVQVMDWGLAKSVDRRPEPGGGAPASSVTIEYSPQAAIDSPHPDVTLAGAILGTPAYMPPEQAIGAIDQIGKPSDVFGLGAILCVILTGKPPYVAESTESARQLAARAKLDEAFERLDACGAEPELVALAKRCLAPEPVDRPRDAGEVAEAVAALRAESEQRARQAEMDRARAEVKSAEERKRRRVQRALALSVMGLLAVAGIAGWWIDSVRSARRADQLRAWAEQTNQENQVEARRFARQVATERDVLAALNEAQVLREQGWKQADDPARWALTLTAAESAQKRAAGILAAGEPTDGLAIKVAAAEYELASDNRDRTLLAELDRITDDNEIQFFIPVSFTKVLFRRFESAFRKNGIDLMSVPPDRAVAWIQGHRYRNRLVTAIRNWQQSVPLWDPTMAIDTHLIEAIGASPAVAGTTAVEAATRSRNLSFGLLLKKTSPHQRLSTILKAVTEDPFTRQWWDAAARHDVAALKKLIAQPELRQFSSRDLSSLADGLSIQSGNVAALRPLLEVALDRFPGEFWVHFRLASIEGLYGSKEGKGKPDNTLLHLTAAVAARPNSAIARTVLGMELMEKRKGDPAGPRMIRGAAEIDPTSPWPHFFLGLMALGEGDWPAVTRAFPQCVRVDPDSGFFMVYSTMSLMNMRRPGGPKPPSDQEIIKLIDALIAARPEHPGGYHLRATYQERKGDMRAALASMRKAKSMPSSDYFGMVLIDPQIKQLESVARWEEKLPAVLRGELKPANRVEVGQLIEYCATFEQKYALAARLAAEALAADPDLYASWIEVGRFAGWAVQAGSGLGADTAGLSPAERAALRQQALKWLQESLRYVGRPPASLGEYLETIRNFNPVRDPKQLASLPPDERAQWEKFWAEIKVTPPVIAPPPREKK